MASSTRTAEGHRYRYRSPCRYGVSPRPSLHQAQYRPRIRTLYSGFLSPHRILPAGEDDAAIIAAIEGETGEALPPRRELRIPEAATDFAVTVLDNLRVAGVQNTRKNERLSFATLKPWPGGALISAEGEYEEKGKRKRAAIVIGPEYGMSVPT